MSKDQALVVNDSKAEQIERLLIGGDLAKLSADERVQYYQMLCRSVGLNPLTRPFEYITLSGKLTLYARKDATDQLRAIRQVGITITSREVVEGCYVVTARALLPSGRTDESIGAVPIDKVAGEARCNSMMKSETKAKRRVTLSICGLGMLDETEIDSIPGAKVGETNGPPLNSKPFVRPAPVAVLDGPRVEDIKPTESIESKIVNSDEPSTLEQQKALIMKFKDALPEKFRPHADQLRRSALADIGYMDEKGVGTSKKILRKDFHRIAKQLIDTASKMKDPYIPSDDDLPKGF